MARFLAFKGGIARNSARVAQDNNATRKRLGGIVMRNAEMYMDVSHESTKCGLGVVVRLALLSAIAIAGCAEASADDAGDVKGSITESVAAVNVTPAATTATFAGFSYHTNGVIKGAGWAQAVVDVMDYNTFTSASYDIRTGTFTAPVAGFYRFSTYGYSPTVTPRPDTRIGLGFALNGPGDHMVAVAGGQLSTVDSPMPFLAHVLHLNTGDKISLWMYTDFAIQLGAANPTPGISAYYFQGEYLGQ